MSLHIMKENFVGRLRASLAGNEGRYGEDDAWVEEFARGSPWTVKTGLDPLDRLELINPKGEDLRDLENSIRIHKALKFLTPLQARDPRLWTRLAHVEFWSYMRRRWSVDRFAASPHKIQQFIVTRYFVAQNQSRALLRNGIARLWWYAHVTYDSHRSDPYELTAILLSQLDITQQILERSIGRAPHVTGGFLEFLQRHRNELLGSGDGKRSRIRHLAKYLNLYGGTTLLDCMSRTDIIGVLEDEYERVMAGSES